MWKMSQEFNIYIKVILKNKIDIDIFQLVD